MPFDNWARKLKRRRMKKTGKRKNSTTLSKRKTLVAKTTLHHLTILPMVAMSPMTRKGLQTRTTKAIPGLLTNSGRPTRLLQQAQRTSTSHISVLGNGRQPAHSNLRLMCLTICLITFPVSLRAIRIEQVDDDTAAEFRK